MLVFIFVSLSACTLDNESAPESTGIQEEQNTTESPTSVENDDNAPLIRLTEVDSDVLLPNGAVLDNSKYYWLSAYSKDSYMSSITVLKEHDNDYITQEFEIGAVLGNKNLPVDGFDISEFNGNYRIIAKDADGKLSLLDFSVR